MKNKGLLAGLWEFPNILIDNTKFNSKSKSKKKNNEDDIIELDTKVKHKAIETYLKKLNLDFSNVLNQKYLGRTKHIFSHLHHFYYVEYIQLNKIGKSLQKYSDEDYIKAIEKLKKEEFEDENYKNQQKK